MDSQIHEQGNRGSALIEAQKTHNRQKSRIRCLVEQIIEHIESSMRGPKLEYSGLERVSTRIGLANPIDNVRRYVQLIQLGRIAGMA